VALTRASSQAGTPWSLIPASASGTIYSAAASPTLAAYTQNQFFSFIPDVNCGASPTLTIDNLGPIALKKISGGTLVTLAANDCTAGVPYHIRAHGSPVDAFVLDTGQSYDSAGTAFASLSGNNGRLVYCPDCKATSSSDTTCAGAGTGALAIRLNSAWKCFQ
jgi:hypothetical protein